MSHCLNRVPSPFTAKGLRPFRNPNGEGDASLSKPHDSSFRAAARENGSVFRVKNVCFATERHIKLESTNKIQH